MKPYLSTERKEIEQNGLNGKFLLAFWGSAILIVGAYEVKNKPEDYKPVSEQVEQDTSRKRIDSLFK